MEDSETVAFKDITKHDGQTICTIPMSGMYRIKLGRNNTHRDKQVELATLLDRELLLK